MTCRERFQMDYPDKDHLDYCPHKLGYAERPPVVRDEEIGVNVCNPNHSCFDCWEREAKDGIEKKSLPPKPWKVSKSTYKKLHETIDVKED